MKPLSDQKGPFQNLHRLKNQANIQSSNMLIVSSDMLTIFPSYIGH